MSKPKIYSNEDVATMCGCSFSTVVHHAQKHENDIRAIGIGRRKTYVWFKEDIDRFRAREVRMGRPPKKTL